MNPEIDALLPENPFSNVSTDKIPLILRDLLTEGAFKEPDAKKIINIFEQTGSLGLEMNNFQPLTNKDEHEMKNVCSTALEKLLWMLDNDKISPSDAKKLMDLFFGDLESGSGNHLKNSPELPVVPEASTIVVFRDKSRKRVTLVFNEYPSRDLKYTTIKD
ncbi:hypothetical protein JW911_00895 [Candidatus Peregrinibacteria bacterium]|nr:hypothetical protein [Candidatus Peregrinibacteria bacterium]